MLPSFAVKLKIRSPRTPYCRRGYTGQAKDKGHWPPRRHEGCGGRAEVEKPRQIEREDRSTSNSLWSACGRWVGGLSSFSFIRLKRNAHQSAAGRVPPVKCSSMAARFLLFFLLSLFVLWLTPSPACAGTVTLTWDANQDPDLKGYILYYGTASGSYTNSFDIGNQTQYSIADLQDRVTYYFAVTAYNDAGNESDYSEELPCTIGSLNNNPTNPDTPNSPSSGYTDSSYTFNTSASDPDGDPLEYNFDWGDGTTSSWGAASRSHSWASAGTFCIKARARDSFGALSGWSKCHSVTIAELTHIIAASAGSQGSIVPSGNVTVSHGSSQKFTISSQYVPEGYGEDSASLPGTIWLEAEIGSLNPPMEVAEDADTSSGQYIYVPEGNRNIYDPAQGGGYAEYTFEVPVSGQYLIWGRIIARDTASDSFYISMDGAEYIEWHTQVSDIWIWDQVSNGSDQEPLVFNLEKGQHTLTVKQRESGTKIDRILITNREDDNYQVQDVLVDGESVGAVTTYSFTNISQDHTIEAIFSRGNQRPVAEAGPDQTVDYGTVVRLMGTESRDPENNIETYTWKQTQGATVSLATPESAETIFVAPDCGASGGTLTFVLTVVDKTGLKSEDTCQVHIAGYPIIDHDNDGIDAKIDNCPDVSNSNQADADHDDVGDACDALPDDPKEWLDTDGDGTGNNSDSDDDNDGIADVDEIELYETDPLHPDTDGDGFSDGEEIAAGSNPLNSTSLPVEPDSVTVYEDAEDGTTDGWDISRADPPGAQITNLYDDVRQTRVIQLTGTGIDNIFRLRSEDLTRWRNSTQFVVEWSMQFSESFVILVDLDTTAGRRLLNYTPVTNNALGFDNIVRFGLGRDADDGQWLTIVRDLKADLAAAQPDVTLLEVNGFFVRGSGRVDDIKLRSSNPDSGEELYQIDASISGCGNISPAGIIEVSSGADMTFSIAPDANCHAAEMIVDGSALDAAPSYTFSNVSSNHTISASFAINAFEMSASVQGAGVISPPGTTTVNYGSDIIYTITPDSGHHIQNVLVDGQSAGAVSTVAFTNISKAHTIEAIFSRNNQPPASDAGPDQTVDHGAVVRLDGTNSRDADNNIETYTWQQIQGTTVSLATATSAETIFAAPDCGPNGDTLTFVLTVVDEGGLKSEDTCQVHIAGYPIIDYDNDGIDAKIDNCPDFSNPNQADADDDGVGDACDALPDDPQEWLDTDGDGTGDNTDFDDDNDGIADVDEIELYDTDPLHPDTDGDGFSDAEEIATGSNPLDFTSIPADPDSTTVYEDAENGTTDGWDITDTDPAGAQITNIYDDVRQSRVIQVTSTGTDNSFRLRNEDLTTWRNSFQFVMEWSMQFAEDFVVYIDLQTTAGRRFLHYRPVDNHIYGTDTYVRYGLGVDAINGQWHSFVRDLQVDLNRAQPDAIILEVNAFLIRGSGKIDDIKLHDRSDTDNDGLVLQQETMITATDPFHPDTDNDGYSDGDEISAGSDPLDCASIPPGPNEPTIYEDAEDGSTTGWDIYDDDPTGAEIANVYDEVRRSHVIQFAGTGTQNGFRLSRNEDQTPWMNSHQFVIEWSIQSSNQFVVCIEVATNDGRRSLQYRANDTDNFDSEVNIHFGLGSDAKDGQWHTFTRDLIEDLAEAQPDLTILEVNTFLVRGSGRVDDITLIE